MTWLEVGVAAAAVWRVTHLLVHEDGPGGGVARVRVLAARLPGGSPLECFLCTSVWVAALPAWAVGGTLPQRLLLIPALSAVAIGLQRWYGLGDAHPPAAWTEDPLGGTPFDSISNIQEDPDELLWTAPNRGPAGLDPLFEKQHTGQPDPDSRYPTGGVDRTTGPRT